MVPAEALPVVEVHPLVARELVPIQLPMLPTVVLVTKCVRLVNNVVREHVLHPRQVLPTVDHVAMSARVYVPPVVRLPVPIWILIRTIADFVALSAHRANYAVEETALTKTSIMKTVVYVAPSAYLDSNVCREFASICSTMWWHVATLLLIACSPASMLAAVVYVSTPLKIH